MNCIVTAGPTYESLDEVRRLTNFSTGQLGTRLAQFLTAQGHNVTLLTGHYASYRAEAGLEEAIPFTTTADLSKRLQSLASPSIHAVFHAAAVSDFKFGRTFVRSDSGSLTEVRSKKLSTRQGSLLVELVPTPKVIEELRDWFPQARLVGWKFEVDGARSDAIRAGREQIERCRTDACVVNGAAYGEGFGLIAAAQTPCLHVPDRPRLYESLAEFLSES